MSLRCSAAQGLPAREASQAESPSPARERGTPELCGERLPLASALALPEAPHGLQMSAEAGGHLPLPGPLAALGHRSFMGRTAASTFSEGKE